MTTLEHPSVSTVSSTARSMGEWKPLATIFSVLAISCAQRVARARAWGGELRDAKNATNSLSSNPLFPDKFIKKAQTTALTYPKLRPSLPITRISNTNSPRRRYIAHIKPKLMVGIYTKRGHLIANLRVIQIAKFEF